MIYLETGSTDPYFNLAFEEYVFEKLDPTKSYFILWQNENTVVVGRHQNTYEEINQRYVEEHGIRVVRRLSGGGAVYHDNGNLNYTFIVDKDAAPDFNFAVFTVPVIKTLERLGVKAEFTGRNDLTIDGRKFCGNAQYVRRGRIMHHGCIMLDSNLEVVVNALKVREAKFQSKGVKSVRSRVTTINAHAPRPIAMEEFKSLLKGYILEAEGLETMALTPEQLDEVRRLRDEKYATWEWNYGASPAYDVRLEERFDFGLVTVYLQADRGRIQAVKIYGDFFGSGELAELEAALVGLPLDGNLEAALEPLDVGRYIQGMTARDLARLLKG
ncbi:lipoate--protein ligase [Symbiobacterium thermophilum]|uniref:lipoate--protein ligase n=2 Tax=Symbiobacterium thermophilum TaxID=2734 RepID=Q67RZ7_SYMTH|nr:lipoate--protein ligase [Symbiobacterium thermophilum]BAD39546.1 lipoate-protein ligase [Symbiobacterium thermophilum IAM 14863]